MSVCTTCHETGIRDHSQHQCPGHCPATGTGFYDQPLTCTLPPDHAQDFHRDQTGTEWRLMANPPAPLPPLSEAEMEEIRSRWLERYGKPGTAHPVDVLEDEEEQP